MENHSDTVTQKSPNTPDSIAEKIEISWFEESSPEEEQQPPQKKLRGGESDIFDRLIMRYHATAVEIKEHNAGNAKHLKEQDRLKLASSKLNKQLNSIM